MALLGVGLRAVRLRGRAGGWAPLDEGRVLLPPEEGVDEVRLPGEGDVPVQAPPDVVDDVLRPGRHPDARCGSGRGALERGSLSGFWSSLQHHYEKN